MTDTTAREPISTMPRWYEFFRPLLEVLADGQTWQKRDMERAVIARAGLSEDEIAETLSSGQPRALNRIGWATSALRRAKAIESPSRAHFRITETGRGLLREHEGAIPEPVVYAIPAYSEYTPARGRKTITVDPSPATVEDADPDELISSGIQLIESDTKSTLLQRLRESDPYDFERVVRSLLVKMGYGRDGTMSPLRGSGDGGLDGVIDRDELGLSKIYVQAKRYAEATIGRPKVQEFVGALATRGANVGVFFTTSRFTAEAVDAAERVPQEIALVDGERLTALMLRHKVGVQVAQTIEILKVDEDFFADE
ncbi:restriction endonuclease [Microbacterium sp. KSW2-21]|uniref:Restriction endonuclease n=1 Tax=Microbacterium algihabitans TaxID=3075992 RepID=A0ABU3RU53_9MICO|nr:restriction endonuclease [Microbacterium sp. KSW2-21]MDU0326307.1 restriction endonuclease [Microbacterium sp. KSW2-21]